MILEELLSHCTREEFETDGQVDYTPNPDVLLRWDGNDDVGIIEYIATIEASADGEEPASVVIQLENVDDSLCYLQAAHLPITVWVRA